MGAHISGSGKTERITVLELSSVRSLSTKESGRRMRRMAMVMKHRLMATSTKVNGKMGKGRDMAC
jgi:hypothetical protein